MSPGDERTRWPVAAHGLCARRRADRSTTFAAARRCSWSTSIGGPCSGVGIVSASGRPSPSGSASRCPSGRSTPRVPGCDVRREVEVVERPHEVDRLVRQPPARRKRADEADRLERRLGEHDLGRRLVRRARRGLPATHVDRDDRRDLPGSPIIRNCSLSSRALHEVGPAHLPRLVDREQVVAARPTSVSDHLAVVATVTPGAVRQVGRLS